MDFFQQSPDGKTHNQIDHILIDRRRHSSVLDVRSFSAADCDTDYCLVVGKIRERVAVNKQGLHCSNTRLFNLGLDNVQRIEMFHVKVSNRFATLEDLDFEVVIKSSWGNHLRDYQMPAKEA
jgi:hypothetical protein